MIRFSSARFDQGRSADRIREYRGLTLALSTLLTLLCILQRIRFLRVVSQPPQSKDKRIFTQIRKSRDPFIPVSRVTIHKSKCRSFQALLARTFYPAILKSKLLVQIFLCGIWWTTPFFREKKTSFSLQIQTILYCPTQHALRYPAKRRLVPLGLNLQWLVKYLFVWLCKWYE